MKKKLCAVLVAISVVVAGFSNMAFAAMESDSDTLTRGEVVKILLASADAYHEGLQESDIIKGYGDGNKNETKPVTRVECLTMVSRAFGTLPEPTGNNKRLSLAYDYFTDIPEWSKTDIENLAKAGVVAGTGNHQLSPNANVTRGQLHSFVTRIWALLGTNEKDDYYNSVNKQSLDNSTISAGKVDESSFSKVEDQNSDRLDSIIKGIANKDGYNQGSKEQKISDFYRGALDTKTRNVLGVSVIQKYLDGINNATSISELENVNNSIYEKSGSAFLVGGDITPDNYDSSYYITVFATMGANMPKDFYTSSDEGTTTAYLKYLSAVLQLTGENQQTADAHAKAFYDMEKKLAAASLSTTQSAKIDNIYNVYTPQELKSLLYNIDIAKVLTNQGFKIPKKILITDVQLAKTFNSYYTNDNLELLKTADKISIIGAFGSMLTTKYDDIADEFNSVYYGGQRSNDTDEEKALDATKSYMTGYLDKMYIDKYFSEEARTDVENMAKEFVSIFKERIQKLTWMSETTKTKAIAKLNALKIKVGYSDDWTTSLDNINITYTAGENSYFDNICAMGSYYAQATAAYQKNNWKVDKDIFPLSVSTVNAGYIPTFNSIVFPAGILESPFYDKNASKEENLAGIGVVMAHEITHAFDNNGAKYDENGNLSNWWTDSDYTKFQELCQKVVAAYDGYEVAPGIYNKGEQTVSENIADLGGMACALTAMGKLSNPDYKKFFESYAKVWCSTATRQYMQYLSQVDVHSLDKARVNRNVVNFDEFYQAYGINENDGMYIPEDQRIEIW